MSFVNVTSALGESCAKTETGTVSASATQVAKSGVFGMLFYLIHDFKDLFGIFFYTGDLTFKNVALSNR